MTQTRVGSFVEAWANIAVGFGINWAANLYILPRAIDGCAVTMRSAFVVGVWFTAISLARSFVIRRWFNGLRWWNSDQPAEHAKTGYTQSRGHLVQRSIFPTDAGLRNEFPMYDGLLAYFPSALAAVARVSKIGNDQHNPGQPMHHARGKSMDHANKIIRHLMEGEGDDIDGTLHADKVAWRALARAQEIHEARGAPLAPGARV